MLISQSQLEVSGVNVIQKAIGFGGGTVPVASLGTSSTRWQFLKQQVNNFK